MSREWVDDAKRPPRPGRLDKRDKRWVMRCDCWDGHGLDGQGRLRRCRTEGEPSVEQPDLQQYMDAGWFIAATHGDRCPACVAAEHPSWTEPHHLMGGAS